MKQLEGITMSLKSPYESLMRLGSGRYQPMGDPMLQMFNKPGTQFSTPVTDAANTNSVGMTGLTNDTSYVSPASLPQPQSLLESLKGLVPGGFLDSTDVATGIKTQGWGTPALGIASGLGNAYMGTQQLNLAKEVLANNKRQFDMNYGAARTTTNAKLEDRQRARVASNPGAYQSVGDYMNKNRVV